MDFAKQNTRKFILILLPNSRRSLPTRVSCHRLGQNGTIPTTPLPTFE
jgi:hypothetical protein